METLIVALLLAFVCALGLGYFAIPLLRRLAGQHIREDGPESHLKKEGTPSMGGLFIMVSVVAVCLIFVRSAGRYTWAAVIGSLAYGLVGMLDDLIKALKSRSLGLRPWQKIFLQLFFGIVITLFAYNDLEIGSTLYIPIADKFVDLGIWYVPFNVLFLLAVTNSVNLTDGLDGLAGGVSLINTATYTLIFFAMMGTAVIAKDMMIFAAAVTGGILGFLRYNSYPAKVIMGDTGAFFLGGALSMMSIISRTQMMIPITGLMFLLTTLSCILQVGSYKLRNGKRIFKMAPLHHHFELKGVHETKIVSTYMIITFILCLVTLMFIIG